jgi:hypothetical protein
MRAKNLTIEARRELRAKRDRNMGAVIGVVGIATSIYSILYASVLWFVALMLFADWIGHFEAVVRWKKPSARWGVQIIFVLAVMILAANPISQEYCSQRAALNIGTLRPTTKGNATSPVLELGDSGVTVPFNMQPGGEWEILQSQHIKVEVIHGVPTFSTIIRDRSGIVIVKIDRNHWETSSDKAVVWDKNYTSDTLEVEDGREKVVLKVRILSDKVQLEGEWHDESGKGVRIADTHAPLVEGGAQIINLQGFDDDPAAFTIMPIFKYPSSENWGDFR